MQILFLPQWLMITLFFVLWFLFQVGAAALCFYMPPGFFEQDGWLFKTRRWERDGGWYQTVFKVRAWKKYLPDGGAWFRGGYAKKHLLSFTGQNLRQFLAESRRAELTHWLAIFPFWVFGLFSPGYVVPLMLVYALALNLPCIVTQRYNRPRISALLQKREGGPP